MSGYSEIRRVRAAMSAEAGHDVRRLIATINERKHPAADRIVDQGAAAKRCDETHPPKKYLDAGKSQGAAPPR